MNLPKKILTKNIPHINIHQQLNPKSLLKKGLYVLYESGFFLKLFCAVSLGAILSFIRDMVYVYTEEYTFAKIIYIILLVINPLINYFCVESIINKMKESILLIVTNEANQIYSSLSHQSKIRSDVSEFTRYKSDARNAICRTITWGFPEIIGIIWKIISCAYIIATKGYWILLISAILSNIVFHYLFTNKIQKKLHQIRKEERKKNTKVNDLIYHITGLFQLGEKSAFEMTNFEINDNTFNSQRLWHQVTFSISGYNNILQIGILLFNFNDIHQVKLLISILSSLFSSSRSLIAFFNNYNDMVLQYKTYCNFWKNKNANSETNIDKPLPKKFTINNFKIIVNNGFILQMKKNLTIRNGCYLVRGDTGSGKSTFFHALMGKIPGLKTTDNSNMSDFFRSFIELYQGIREKMKFSNITIRELFENEADDQIIIRLLRFCLLDSLYERKGLDKPICEDLSGGQKSLLSLAPKLYKLEQKIANSCKQKKKYVKRASHKSHNMFKKHICMLVDEFEQGLDPNTAGQIFTKLINKYNHITFIFSTHLCDCVLKEILPKVTATIFVDNGVITHKFHKKI